MSNCRFTFRDVAIIQRHVRVSMSNGGELPSSQIWELLDHAIDAARAKQETPKPVEEKKPEPKPEPRPKVTEHKEKSFEFSDGTVWQRCSATDCMWGVGRCRTHSLAADDTFVGSDEQEAEIDADDATELSVEELIAKSTPETEPEPDEETEVRWDEEEEQNAETENQNEPVVAAE